MGPEGISQPDELAEESIESEVPAPPLSPQEQLIKGFKCMSGDDASELPFFIEVRNALVEATPPDRNEAEHGDLEALDALEEKHPWLIDDCVGSRARISWLAAVKEWMENERKRAVQLQIEQANGYGWKPKPQKPPKRTKQSKHPESPKSIPTQRDFFVLRSRNDIDRIPKGTTVVHLTKQAVATLLIFDHLASNLPNLELIQASPSVLQFMNTRGWKVRKMTHPWIKIRVGSLKERNYDGVENHSEYYDRNVEPYFEMLEDEEKSAIFDRMLAAEMHSALLAQKYMDDGPISFRFMAMELGLSYRYVQRKCQIFFAWIGKNTPPDSIRDAVENLEPELIKREEIAENAQCDGEFRNRFTVKEVVPPAILSAKKLETWQRIQVLWKCNRDAFKRITTEQYYALAAYYHLPPFEDTETVFGASAAQVGLTHHADFFRKNSALTMLGLQED